jgi:hypothetical protein
MDGRGKLIAGAVAASAAASSVPSRPAVRVSPEMTSTGAMVSRRGCGRRTRVPVTTTSSTVAASSCGAASGPVWAEAASGQASHRASGGEGQKEGAGRTSVHGCAWETEEWADV